jgi:hypothetical protein
MNTSTTSVDSRKSNGGHLEVAERSISPETVLLNAPLVDITRQFQVSLKYRRDEEDDHDGVSPNRKKHPPKCVHFDSNVSMVEICSHRDLSESTRQRLWSSFAEIHVNAERNIIEFRADNCDWRQACEDLMYDRVTGQLFHPASFKRQRQSQKRKGERKKCHLHRRKARLYAN